jgi:hypothetical protein
MRDALTSGYTAGILGAGAFYLAAILAAVLLLRPRPGSQGTRSKRRTAPEQARSTQL